MTKYNEKEYIQTVDNKLVGVAIGQDTDGYFVQTTDLDTDTHLSELITSGLKMKSHAYAIAETYKEKYRMEIFDWTLTNQREIDILCPECKKGILRENDEYTEAYCDSCGLEFLLTGEISIANKEYRQVYYSLRDKFNKIVVTHHDKVQFLSLAQEYMVNEIIDSLGNYDEKLIIAEVENIKDWFNILTIIKYSESIDELKDIFTHCGLEYELIGM